jgi:uncharacterized Fe-S center protein
MTVGKETNLGILPQVSNVTQIIIMEPDEHRLKIPKQMKSSKQAWPIIYVKIRGANLLNEAKGVAHLISDVVGGAIKQVHDKPVHGQTLLKVHIGEPKCATRMRPEYILGSAHFLRDNGAEGIVAGDTTVAYTGMRGHKENSSADCSRYLQLAHEHGWSTQNEGSIPFVVLDRPATARKGQFEFDEMQKHIKVHGVKNYRNFNIAGGFAAADFVINHAHATLHGLAGFAGTIKSIAMGCSGLTGKLQMHKSLLPQFDEALCICCGECVESCPEGALRLEQDASFPLVDPELCIGCGECEAVCHQNQRAVTMKGKDIKDWDRGGESLPVRMADYTIGLMNGRWNNVVHILHMYAVTKRCDCVNAQQEPLLKHDLGFLIGKNPFAIDRLAVRMLVEALNKEGHLIGASCLESIEATTKYVNEVYGISSEVPVKKISLS